MDSITLQKEQLAETIRTWYRKGWSPATSTNYSFRDAANPDVLYVSRSGIDKSQFSSADFMEVGRDGKALSGFEHLKPSAETLIHCTLYDLFPETQCIVHSHSVYSVLHSAVQETAVTMEGYEVLKGFEGVATHDTTVTLPIFDNTQDMAAFSQTLTDQRDRLAVPAFIMRKHGTYAWGKNQFDAKRHLETAEYLLECEWLLKK